LWCGLLNAAQYNINRQQTRVRLFETGLRFVRQQGETQQQKMLAGLALGSTYSEQWGEKTRNIDFFDVKADIEALLSLSANDLTFRPAQHPALHPGQTAEIIDSSAHVVGILGMLHPNPEKQLGFDGPVFLFELAQEAILQRTIAKFTQLSKFPSVRRDMALLVRQQITAQQIINCINSSKEVAVREVAIFDIYQGKGIEEGFKSVAVSLVLQDFAQTLTDLEIDAIFRRLLDKMTAQLNARLRD
jgi:phenylalanyl-tRNA synthetase beta chain